MTFDSFIRRVLFRLRGRVIHIGPQGAKRRGNVLLSYTTLPFLDRRPELLDGHTNRWECLDMVQGLTERGYAVDVIDITNTSFIPKKKYDYLIDNGSNMQRLAKYVGPHCAKVFHATAAYWNFQNNAEKKRLQDLQVRRGVVLSPRRQVEPYELSSADMISSVCGPLAESTYAFLKKPLWHIPLSTTHTYPAPQHKDFSVARKQFVWFGGSGAVHKGLDLVLEAFAAMPEYTLLVCGKFSEEDFTTLYHKELYESPNIKSIGYISPGSPEFKKMMEESLGMVFPSCSEGCASSVVITMHAGLIPVISKETGVETEDFGIILATNSITEIRDAVQQLAHEPTEKLQKRAMGAWRYAREHHTRELFAKSWREFIDVLELNHV